jgi:protoheme IX farnesyltransferase
MPMLPVTHGESFTLLHILLYTIIMIVVTFMPVGSGMSGLIYFLSALILNAIFLYYVVKLYKNYSDKLSMKTFKYSIVYLSLIFSALLLDHYFKISLQF